MTRSTQICHLCSKTKMLLFASILSASFQNMVAYVMLAIVISVRVYSLTISEIAVTFS